MRRAVAKTSKRVAPLSGAAAHVRSLADSGSGRPYSVSHASPGLAFEANEILEGLARGEFEAWFQPQVHMRTLRVAGAAALARWNRPRTGIVRPHGFVPALEEAGESDVLACFMLKAAAALRADWAERGESGTIAISVSLRSLAHERSMANLTETLAAGALDPHGVILDVTAPVPAGDAHDAIEHLLDLHARGFAVAIDSYGHGYLSMQQLVDVPFTRLRIAPVLTESARRHDSARALLSSSIEAAHAVGIEVIAEKLETAEDWDLMAALGCDIAQGSYIADPMAGRNFLDWLNVQQGARVEAT